LISKRTFVVLAALFLAVVAPVHVVSQSPPVRSNVALAANGAITRASSSFASTYDSNGVVNGERRGLSWGQNGGWNDGTADTFPDWVEVEFYGTKTLDQIDVFTLQDSYASPSPPTLTMTFTQYGLRDFEVQYWTGTAWQLVPGAAVTGNNFVWRQFPVGNITTSKIRVLVTNAAGSYSRITEIEAYGTPAAGPPPAPAHPLASRVLVVNNIRFTESVDVANYYMSQRGIPDTNRCSIDVPDSDDLSAATYHFAIKAPIQACLDRLGRATILYIVFTPMAPVRMVDAMFASEQSPGYDYRAIDSMVANIWTADETAESDNPYSASSWDDPGSQANVYAPFLSMADFRTTNPSALVYSVWRLDAASAAQAKGLVDKAKTAETYGLSGQGCFDRLLPNPLGPDEGYNQGDWDIQRAHETVIAAGFPSTLDVNAAEFGAAPAPARCDGAAFYVGWYSYGMYHDVFTWAAGAMGWHYDSLSLHTPRNPTSSWGGGAIAAGITITAGSVAEPYLQALPHYDGFLKNVLAGAVVGDAMLRNTEFLQWQIVYAGDPLYRPFMTNGPPLDTTPPTVSISAPANNATVSGPSVGVSADAADNTGGAGVRFLLDGSTLGVEDTTSPYAIVFDSTSISNGSHSLAARARDTAGNVTTSAITAILVDNGASTPDPTNVALAANGGVATASSVYGFAYGSTGTNNGDRRGSSWGAGGGWADGTQGAYPDWLQVDFAGARTITRVNVFSIQDNYASPAEPTSGMVFTQYGLRDFEVQYWTGSAWQAVPEGTVTGNNLVWRQFTFQALTTPSIRIVVTDGLAGFSRIAEVEVFGTSTDPPPPGPTGPNLALPANGGVMSASSSYGTEYGPSGANNGDRKGQSWGSGGGWADATPNAYPDVLQLDFAVSQTITEIHVFSIQDNYSAPAEPTPGMVFTQYGLRDFEVQYWTGSAWQAVPGGTVTGNNLVWRKFTFPAITTSKVRIVVAAGLGSYSRIAEVEVYGPPPG